MERIIAIGLGILILVIVASNAEAQLVKDDSFMAGQISKMERRIKRLETDIGVQAATVSLNIQYALRCQRDDFYGDLRRIPHMRMSNQLAGRLGCMSHVLGRLGY